MSDLYKAYRASGAPALPSGYSFLVENRFGALDYDDRYFFSIIGPPKGLFKKRRKEFIDADYLPYDYGHTFARVVSNIDRKQGAPPVEDWFVDSLRALYGLWRTSTYTKDTRARWDAFVGVHP